MTGFAHRHLLGMESLVAAEIAMLLDLGDRFLEINERPIKKVPTLRGKTVINLFLGAVDAHAHVVRDRGQAAVGRRGQHLGLGLVDGEGRDAARHGAEPRRDGPRRGGGAPRAGGRRRRCSPRACGPAWSTRATARTSTRPRRCSTARRSARTRGGSRGSTSSSAATSATAASRARTSGRSPSWGRASGSSRRARCWPRASRRWATPRERVDCTSGSSRRSRAPTSS